LKADYLTIIGSLIKTDEPRVAVNIAAMSDEQARTSYSKSVRFLRALRMRWADRAIPRRSAPNRWKAVVVLACSIPW
jgi:hypothetical protein